MREAFVVFTLLVPWCHSADLQSLHYDANLLLTVPHCTFGDIIRGALNRVNMLFFCSISARLLCESSSLYK